MKHSSMYTRSTMLSFRYSRRLLSGLLLLTLLVMHAKIMLEGCLVAPHLPAALQSMEQMDGSCTEPASPTERVCLVHCEFLVNKPKFVGEILSFDNIAGLPAVFLVIGLFAGLSHHASFPTLRPSVGLPLYLLFLRLFIPIHYCIVD